LKKGCHALKKKNRNKKHLQSSYVGVFCFITSAIQARSFYLLVIIFEAIFIPAKQRAKRELARIWRLPRGSNTPPLWGELAKKKLSHAPLLAAGYLTGKT
jgi:hypothetical protein